MKNHKTFRENQISNRENRLIFENGNSGGESAENSNFTFNPNIEDFKNRGLKEYQNHLKKAKAAGLDQATFDAKNREAIRLFKEWGEQNKEEKSTEELKKKIETARRNREDKKLRKKTVDSVEERFLSGADEIRQFVRSEIEGFLKIEVDHLENEAFEEFLDFESEILESILGLLKGNDYEAIQKTIEKDKERAKKCYRNLRSLFEDEKKKKFLNLLLSTKGIPAGEKMNITKLNDLAQKMEGRWDQTDSIIGVVDGQKLKALEQSIDSVEMLFRNWDLKKEVKSRDELLKNLFDYEKRFASFDLDMIENPPKSIELSSLIEIWPELRDCRKNDSAKIKEIITKNQDESSLRIAQAFLDGSLKELDALEKDRAQFGAQEKIENNIEDTGKGDQDKDFGLKKTPLSTSVPELGFEDGSGHEHSNAINRFGKRFFNFVTAKGDITWYSFHDIGQAFHLIKESWKKHTESFTEDKSGGVAYGLMAWKKEVQRRVHETDLIAEKGRADERKKRYKNLSYEELVAEITDIPPKDKRRAILETLAERGNLRMSDHSLIDAVTYHSVAPEEWNYADANCDYAEIIRKFKSAIDHKFINEVGYGQQLIDMQTSGQANKESLGEKLGDHSVAGSPAAESAMVAVQIDNAGLDGDNVVTGLLKKGFGRGNKFADNGAMVEMKFRTEKDDDEKIRDNGSAGFDALKIVDGYLKGLLSSQTVQGISKKNEGGYTPYAAFQDVLVPKEDEIPPGSGHYVSKFEKWGWIRGGKITNLGKRQIVNFIDSRVAFDSKNNIIHIAKDSGTYSRHSTKHTSIAAFRSLGVPVADKMRTTCIKAGGVEVYDNATQRSQNNNELIGSQQEVTFLIKAACEEIEDGIAMIQHNNGNEDVEKEGHVRLEKGTKALEIMFGNIIKNTEDRDIFTRAGGNPAYGVMYREKDIDKKETYGRVTKDKKDAKDLLGFLTHYLIEVTHADQKFSSHYNRVMRAYKNLADPSKILSRDLRDAKNRADQRTMQDRYSDAT